MKPEYRVVYRRESRKKQYRIFQHRTNALRFMTDLKKATVPYLPPLVELEFEERSCGAWSPSKLESEPAQ